MSFAIFNLDGTLSRKRKTPCTQCGAMEECDDCWEHVSDWSPFSIWKCQTCEMPMFVYGAYNDERPRAHLCDFCGFDERDGNKWRTWDKNGVEIELEWSEHVVERPK
jgi:hypothetical protein